MEALNRGESVQLTYRGKVLGTVSPEASDAKAEEVAIEAFFGMHKHLAVDTVEEELRSVREGRRVRDDI